MYSQLSLISFATLASFTSVTEGFAPSVNFMQEKSISRPSQPLYLHPDQAQELEAAATQFLQESPIDKDVVYSNYLDDTKQDALSASPLSAASSAGQSASSNSQPEQKKWTKTFFNLIRHDNWGTNP